LQRNFPIQNRNKNLSSEEFYEELCRMIQDRNLDVLVFNEYSVSLQVIESYLIQNHGLKLKKWSNTITSNPEIRSALKELQTIYLDNIQVGPEAKLLFLTAISAVGYHNSNIEYDNSQGNKLSHSE
jgi:hypothetical protein